MRFGTGIALLAAVCWGFVYARLDKVLETMTPIACISAFYLVGGVVLIPAMWVRHAEIMDALTHTEFWAAIGVTLVAEFLIIWSISLLGGTDAGLMEITYPVFTALFTYLLYHQAPTMQTAIGGVLVFLGVLVLSSK